MDFHFEQVTFLRPTDQRLSPQTRFRIQVLRLLSVFAALVIPLYGVVLHGTSVPTDPLWLRFAMAGLLLGLLGASYVFPSVRRNYPTWGRGMLYLLMVWFTGVAAANGFTGSYDVGLVVLYAVLLAGVGIGERSIWPVLRFAGVGMLLSTGSILWTAAPDTEPLILIFGMGILAVVGCIVIQGGITIQKKLLAQERLLRTVNANVSDGIYRSVPEEGIVYANQAFAEMFGAESVDAIRTVDPASLYADPAERRRLRERIREEGSMEAVEIEFRRRDGSTFTGLLNCTVVRGEDGEIRSYDGTITDISKQKRRERQLAKRNRQLKHIRENVTEVVWMSPADKSTLEFISQAYEDVWGRPVEEVETHPDSVVEAIHPDDRDRVREAIGRQKEEPDAYEEVYRVVRPDGTIRWVRDRAAGVYDETGKLERIVGVATDVTERRRLQERLLEVQAEERRRMTEEIHGELGGRVTSLQFAVQAARQDNADDEVAEHLDRIESLVSSLSTSLRSMSRKLYPSDLVDYGLVEALPTLADEVEQRRGLTVDLQSDLDREDRFSSLVERTAYKIVRETLVNAARHAEADRAQVVVRKNERQLFVRVSDEGVGFVPSQAGGDATSGLEAMRRRVERLRGEVEVETGPGQGTAVSVTLPFDRFT